MNQTDYESSQLTFCRAITIRLVAMSERFGVDKLIALTERENYAGRIWSEPTDIKRLKNNAKIANIILRRCPEHKVGKSVSPEGKTKHASYATTHKRLTHRVSGIRLQRYRGLDRVEGVKGV